LTDKQTNIQTDTTENNTTLAPRAVRGGERKLLGRGKCNEGPVHPERDRFLAPTKADCELSNDARVTAVHFVFSVARSELQGKGTNIMSSIALTV